MSLLPYISNETSPFSFYRFGSGFHPSDSLISPVERALLRSFNNPGNYLRSQLSQLNELEEKVHIDKDSFQVCLDVEHFLPNEISVKTENNSVIVHAKHGEKRDDHGFISREFIRRYELPKGFETENLRSNLSSDGILSLECPHTSAGKGSKARQVQVQHTGPAKHCIKHKKEKK